MIDWTKISTVLLDMDGTLLDLHFDNYFWQEYVPDRYAEKHGISLARAKEELSPRFEQTYGKLAVVLSGFLGQRAGSGYYGHEA